MSGLVLAEIGIEPGERDGWNLPHLIAFSWFDPDLGQYQTTHSRPIALSVRAAALVSAADVVTNQGTGGPDDASERAGATPAAVPAETVARPAFTLTGAELAIETQPHLLQRNPVPWYARPVVIGLLYLSGFAALGLAILARRRASVDPAVLARRRTLEAERRMLEQAARVGDMARALRRMAAAAPRLPRDEYDALLMECDNLAYAPNAGDTMPIDPGLRARALVIADSMLEGAR